MQIRKTYRNVSPEMLRDEIGYLLQKQEIGAGQAGAQTYSVPSGQTQTRLTVPLVRSDQKECGSLHILSFPGGETKMTLDLDETLLDQDKLASLGQDLEFLLGTYEVRW